METKFYINQTVYCGIKVDAK